MKYDYREAVKADILDYIREHYTTEEIRENLENRHGWAENLHNDLWNADSVTGNASGSYYCNAWKAEEALCHNLDLLEEAAAELGDGLDVLKNGAEACDVTIRCYLLWGAMDEALDELEEELEEE